MSGQPPLTQVVGRTENAFGALIHRVLAPTGATFHQWVCLSVLSSAGGALPGGRLVERVTDALKVDRTFVAAVVKQMDADDYLHGDLSAGEITLTERGRGRFGELRRAIEVATSPLYDGLAEEELATTRRVLENVGGSRERAACQTGTVDRRCLGWIWTRSRSS
jgi:DNA-binding MarR family transcriptional regulator